MFDIKAFKSATDKLEKNQYLQAKFEKLANWFKEKSTPWIEKVERVGKKVGRVQERKGSGSFGGKDRWNKKGMDRRSREQLKLLERLYKRRGGFRFLSFSCMNCMWLVLLKREEGKEVE